MQQTSNKKVSPFYSSITRFGVELENNFVFSTDAKHLIGVDGTDSTRIIVEDISTGSSFSFGRHSHVVSTLVFDDDSSTLLAGDCDGIMIQYNLDLAKKKCVQVKSFGDLEIGWVLSSFRLKGFVFFGGYRNRIRALDLSSNTMLPGHVETAVAWVHSLQVCVVNASRVYLAMVGFNTEYSSSKSDLYDIGELLKNRSLPKKLVQSSKDLFVSEFEFDQRPRQVVSFQSKKTISVDEHQLKRLLKDKVSVFKKKTKKLEKKLTKKSKKYDALLLENKKLKDQIKQLKTDNASDKETISTILRANEDLNKKLNQLESEKRQYTQLQLSGLKENELLRSTLLQQKRKSDAKISRLNIKLSLLNSLRKTQAVSPKGRRYKTLAYPVNWRKPPTSKRDSASKPARSKISRQF